MPGEPGGWIKCNQCLEIVFASQNWSWIAVTLTWLPECDIDSDIVSLTHKSTGTDMSLGDHNELSDTTVHCPMTTTRYSWSSSANLIATETTTLLPSQRDVIVSDMCDMRDMCFQCNIVRFLNRNVLFSGKCPNSNHKMVKQCGITSISYDLWSGAWWRVCTEQKLCWARTYSISIKCY